MTSFWVKSCKNFFCLFNVAIESLERSPLEIKSSLFENNKFRKHYEDQRALMEGKDLLTYCAEHCFTPDEALLRQGDNIFNSELVSERLTDIRVHKQGIKPKHYVLE